MYLGAYLAVATVLTLGLIELLSTWNNGYYELEVTFENGLTQRGVVDSGPYIYDPVARELLPASELDLPGDGPLAVFIATGDWEAGDDYAPEGADAASVIHATVDMVRDGTGPAVRLGSQLQRMVSAGGGPRGEQLDLRGQSGAI